MPELEENCIPISFIVWFSTKSELSISFFGGYLLAAILHHSNGIHMASLSEVLEINRRYREVISPSIQKAIAMNEKFKASSAVHEKMQPYLENLRLIKQHEDVFSKTALVTNNIESFTDAIKLNSYFWEMASFKPVSLDDYLPAYDSFFSILGAERHPSSFNDESTNDLLQAEYELVTEPHPTNSPISSEQSQALIYDESQRIRRIILDIYQNNSGLLQLEPRQFEEVVAELLRKQGFEATLTKQTRDGGYDIMAVLTLNGHAPLTWLVECKRFSKMKVDVDVVRRFKEVIQSNNANRGIIATTSYFTKDAQVKREQTPWLLDFRDKNDIMQWVTNYATGNSSLLLRP